jgi:hypothetical protein
MKYQSAWGRWASPSEFVKSASVAKHPMLENRGIDDVLAAVIAEILSLGAVAVSRKRFQEILQWRARATELQPAEDAIHAEWHESQRNVLSGKRFLLMKEMLEQINYQDSGLIEELLEGAKLTGANKPSNVFPKICPWKIPTSDSQLRAKSKWVRKALRAQCKPAAEASFDVAVWAATEAVLQKKWLSGPFDSEEAVSTAIGTEDWIPSPRFGLKQGSKIRAIDNYSAGGVNGAFVADEKVDLQGIDHVAALAKALATAVADDRTYCLTSNSGKELRGVIHSSWSLSQVREVVGRTLDLEAAYRQIALCPGQQWSSILIVWNPVLWKPQFFLQHALPFGAAASVLLF